MSSRSKPPKVTLIYFKQQHLYRPYRRVFCHRQTRFLLTKINRIFAAEFTPEATFELEVQLMRHATDPHSWAQALVVLSQQWPPQWAVINWAALGIFLFYIYHYPQYYCRHPGPRLYTQTNFLQLNIQKMHYYNQWIKSMYEAPIHNFNHYVIALLRLIK